LLRKDRLPKLCDGWVVGNLLVGTSYFFVDTTTNPAGINTSSPIASVMIQACNRCQRLR